MPQLGQHRLKAQLQTGPALHAAQKLYAPELSGISRGGGQAHNGAEALNIAAAAALVLAELPHGRLFCGEKSLPVQAEAHPAAGEIGMVNADIPQRGGALAVVCGHDVVRSVGEQAGSELQVLGPAPQLPALAYISPGLFRHLRHGAAYHHRLRRQPLLEQQGIGGHGAVGHEELLGIAGAHGVGGGNDAHAHMMGHVAAHLFHLAPAAGGGEVQGLHEAVAAPGSPALQTAQVLHRRLRLYGQGQKAAVGGDDQIRLLAPLQGQGRTAVGLVAVAEGGVQRVKGALRYAPGAAGQAPPPLGIEAEAAALIQQAAAVHRQKQLRHEVFKHGARPAGKAPVAVLLQLGPAQPPPVLYGHVAPGYGQIAGEHGLAGHKVVPASGSPAVLGVVADIE